MPVTATQIDATAIGDGRQSVIFKYTLSDSSVVFSGPRDYPIATDLNARAAAQGIVTEEEVKLIELADCVSRLPWNYILQHTTTSDLVAYVRALYRDSSRDDLAKVAARILEWIANGRFTDTQVRNAFGLNASQWSTLKAKMSTLVNNYNAVQAAGGE